MYKESLTSILREKNRYSHFSNNHADLVFPNIHFTCAVKKAGVREPEGSAGLLRAMEPMSVPASSREGAEISRALGFLLFGGSPSP